MIFSSFARSCNLDIEHVHESCKDSLVDPPQESFESYVLPAPPWLRYWYVECARPPEATLRPRAWELLGLRHSGQRALPLLRQTLSAKTCEARPIARFLRRPLSSPRKMDKVCTFDLSLREFKLVSVIPNTSIYCPGACLQFYLRIHLVNP